MLPAITFEVLRVLPLGYVPVVVVHLMQRRFLAPLSCPSSRLFGRPGGAGGGGRGR